MVRARGHLLASLIAFALSAMVATGDAAAAQKSSRASKKTQTAKAQAATASRRTKQKAAEKKKKAPDVQLTPAEPPVESQHQNATASAPPPTRGPTRIDFDDRLIQGQTNKSGAVYLYDRKELKIRSMVKQRESFREEIVSTVYDS